MKTFDFNISLKKLVAHNFRGLKSIELDFDEKLTILIAANGGGKTSVLDCIKHFLQFVESVISGKGYQLDAFGYKNLDVNNSADSSENELDLFINKLTFNIKNTISKHNESITADIGGDNGEAFYDETQRKVEELQKESISFNIPVLVYYRSNSLNISPEDVKLVIPKNKRNTIFSANDGTLNGSTFSFRDFYIWFERQQKISLQKGKGSLLEPIREAISKMLNDEDNSVYGKLEIKWMEEYDEMILLKGDEEINVLQLSSGEKTLLALVGDLARRLAIANPHKDNPLEGQGIVLIDEIDLHLHPNWQRRVVPKLREIFPNVQFVVTTHSVLVLNHLESKHIRELINGKAHGVSATYGQSSEAILEDIMGTPSSKYAKELEGIYECITLGDLQKAKEKLTNLQNQIEGSHPEIAKLTSLIKRKEILKK